MSFPLAAVVYADGVHPDRVLRQALAPLRERGVPLAGLLQVEEEPVADSHPCDMRLEELAGGDVVRLAEYRGRHARGCRLDVGVLTELAEAVQSSLQVDEPRLLVINKFGKVEADGGGLREAIGDAVALGIPVLVGVPLRNLESWRAFAGDLATELVPDVAAIGRWLDSHRLRSAGPSGRITRDAAIRGRLD
jgi:hypothetical protein